MNAAHFGKNKKRTNLNGEFDTAKAEVNGQQHSKGKEKVYEVRRWVDVVGEPSMIGGNRRGQNLEINKKTH